MRFLLDMFKQTATAVRKGQDTTIPISEALPTHSITSVKRCWCGWLPTVIMMSMIPSVGMLLNWLINDDNDDDEDHDDNDEGHGHRLATMMYMVVASDDNQHIMLMTIILIMILENLRVCDDAA